MLGSSGVRIRGYDSCKVGLRFPVSKAVVLISQLSWAWRAIVGVVLHTLEKLLETDGRIPRDIRERGYVSRLASHGKGTEGVDLPEDETCEQVADHDGGTGWGKTPGKRSQLSDPI